VAPFPFRTPRHHHGAMRRLLPPCGLLVLTVALTGCAPGPGSHRGSPDSSPLPVPSTTAASRSTTTRPATPPASGAGTIGPVIVEPDAGIAPIYTFMSGATSTLTMTMYELVDPTAEQILVADARRGVRVRVLLDGDLEAQRNQPAEAYLSSHGVSVALGPAGRITHQKTICVDDHVCLIMTLNLVADDYASTRDVAVEDSDPADVSAIESTFADDFAGQTGPGSSAGDHLLWSPGSEPGIVGLIDGARHTLEVENEEMDSSAVTDALVAAAQRGVDVEVCMTADSEYTQALDQISAAGGHVHLYPDSDGVIYIHEKLLLADAGTASATAAVGSINFSTTSMDDNRELDLVLDEQDEPGPLATLSDAFQKDFAGAPPL
jgi:cardiolipin synthase A/B